MAMMLDNIDLGADISFKSLRESNKFREVTVFRYRVVNYASLDKIIFSADNVTKLILDQETQFVCLMNSYNENKTTRSLSSNQNPGDNQVLRFHSLVLISDLEFPREYYDTFYIYTIAPLIKINDVSDNVVFQVTNENFNWYIDEVESSMLPSFQAEFIDNKSPEKTSRNLLNLRSAYALNDARNSRVILLHVDNFEKIAFDENVVAQQFRTDGLLGEFQTVVKSPNGNRLINYEFGQPEQRLVNYLPLGVIPIKNSPTLTLFTNSLNEKLALRGDIARGFISGQSLSNVFLGTARDFTNENSAQSKLKFAINTILFLAREFKKDMQNYFENDPNSQNFGKIKINLLDPFLYGIASINLTNEPTFKTIARKILISGEREFPEFETNKDLKLTYDNLQAALAMLGKYVPNDYAIGEYEKINDYALSYYFDITNYDQLTTTNLKTFEPSLIVKSRRFDMITDGVQMKISGLKSEWSQLNATKKIDLGFDIATPAIPSQGNEQTAISRFGAMEPSDYFNIFGHIFYKPIWGTLAFPNRDFYAEIFGGRIKLNGDDFQRREPVIFKTNQPYNASSTSERQYAPAPIFSELTDDNHTPVAGETLTDEKVRIYIEQNLVSAGRVLVENSFFATIENYSLEGKYAGLSYGYITGYDVSVTFVFKEKLVAPADIISTINTPSILDLQTYSDWIASTGVSSPNIFFFTPLQAQKSIQFNAIKRISGATTFASYFEIPLKLFFKGGSKSITIKLSSPADYDDTIVRTGVRV